MIDDLSGHLGSWFHLRLNLFVPEFIKTSKLSQVPLLGVRKLSKSEIGRKNDDFKSAYGRYGY